VVAAIGRIRPAESDTDKSFLMVCVTDGEENESERDWLSLREAIQARQATDRWTFVFWLPPGMKASFVARSGVYEGNVNEWAGTEIEKVRAVTQSAGTNYFAQRSRGVRSSKTFFAPDASKIGAAELSRLTDVTNLVRTLEVKESGKQIIEGWINVKTGGKFRPGRSFFELMKREDEVQSYKLLLLRSRTTKRVYADGPTLTVRAALGLPDQTVPIEPGNHGGFQILVQSMSSNRILPYGTTVVFYEGAVQ
jgi:hypothetical protein